MSGAVNLLWIGTSALRDDDLATAEQLVTDTDRLSKEATRIPTEIEHKTFKIAELIKSVVEFAACGFLELCDVEVADTGTDLILEID